MCRIIHSGVLLVLAMVVHVIIAQTNQNRSGSPFAPGSKNSDSTPEALRSARSNGKSAGNHGNPGTKDVVPVKSPFTPPPSGAAGPDDNFRPRGAQVRPSRSPDTRSQDTQRSTGKVPREEKTQGGSSDVTSAPKRKAAEVRGTPGPKPVGSPFRPPVQTEWREGQRSNPPAQPLQEPTFLQGSRSSPSPVRKGSNPGKEQRRVNGQESPFAKNRQEKDIHEAAPGVTPWTRYTPRPKVRVQEEPQDARTGRCSGLNYSPRSQICCQGRVKRRQGMKPSCCGRQSFDSAFSKCCGGVVSLRTSQQPECP